MTDIAGNLRCEKESDFVNETPLGFPVMRAVGQSVPKSLRKKLKRLWEQVIC